LVQAQELQRRDRKDRIDENQATRRLEVWQRTDAFGKHHVWRHPVFVMFSQVCRRYSLALDLGSDQNNLKIHAASSLSAACYVVSRFVLLEKRIAWPSSQSTFFCQSEEVVEVVLARKCLQEWRFHYSHCNPSLGSWVSWWCPGWNSLPEQRCVNICWAFGSWYVRHDTASLKPFTSWAMTETVAREEKKGKLLRRERKARVPLQYAGPETTRGCYRRCIWFTGSLCQTQQGTSMKVRTVISHRMNRIRGSSVDVE